jgi:hypothetical protein
MRLLSSPKHSAFILQVIQEQKERSINTWSGKHLQSTASVPSFQVDRSY